MGRGGTMALAPATPGAGMARGADWAGVGGTDRASGREGRALRAARGALRWFPLQSLLLLQLQLQLRS
jgi:hypothetical protein